MIRFPWWYGLYPADLFSAAAVHLGRLLKEGFIPYLDIRSDLAPISALVYYLIDLVPADTMIAQRWAAMLLLGYQAVTFNGIVAKFRMHKELSNYVAFAYVTLGLAVLHGAYLSPTLIALSFLIPALGRLAAVIAGKQSEDTYFSIGFFFALAMLAELRISILLLCLVWVLLAFSDANGKKIGILLIGSLFPFLMLYVGASFMDANPYMWRYLLESLLDLNLKEKLNVLMSWRALLAPSLVLFIAIVFHQGIRGLSLNQQKFKNLFLSWGFFCLIGLLLFNDTLSDGLYLFLLPAGAYFLSQFWLLVKSKWWLLPVNVLLILQVLFINGRPLGELLPLSENPWDVFISEPGGSRNPFPEAGSAPVWIIGGNQNDTSPHVFQGLYIQSSIKEKEFQDSRSHSGLIRVSQAFEKQAPLFIVDSMGIAVEIFERLPELKKRYHKQDSLVYRRID